MANKNEEVIVISLGGSLIFPESIDTNFLKDFREFILQEIKLGKKFILICGGGKICRRYQTALTEINKDCSTLDKDWMGIKVTQTNATLVKLMFGKLAKFVPNFDPVEKVDFDVPIYISAGFKPGHSTDTDAVLLAAANTAKKVVNLSNVKYLYNKDPSKFSDAIKLEEVTWEELISVLPSSWEPGMNVLFDPIAAKKAKELGLELAIIKGEYFREMGKFFKGEKFIGTRVY